MTYRIIFIREPSNYESFGDSIFAVLQQFRMTPPSVMQKG